jgi:hypothetical protein
MSVPTGDLDIGATKPIFIFRASGDGAFGNNCKVATVATIIIIATIKASIFFCKFTSSFLFICYIEAVC